MFTKHLQANLVARCLLVLFINRRITKYYVNPKCTIDKKNTLVGSLSISLVFVTQCLSAIAHFKAQSLQISILDPIESLEITTKRYLSEFGKTGNKLIMAHFSKSAKQAHLNSPQQ
jgi:hypothetical protein